MNYAAHVLRQGDVLLRPIQSTPDFAGLTKKKDIAVAYGEHSGHAHVATQGAEVFEIDGKLYIVTGKDGGMLEHIHQPTGRQADHHALKLAPNTAYEVVLQNQYNPYTKLMEQVID